MPVPIVCFVGKSNSGKTTFIERVIPELVRAGYKIATVKHAGHGFDLDTEGKDSWRHKQAGASSVVILSKGSMAAEMDSSAAFATAGAILIIRRGSNGLGRM